MYMKTSRLMLLLGDLAGTWLAARAEVAAAPRDHEAPDRPAATTAGFAGALVNAQALGVIAGAALDVNVVAEARALELHGVLQDFPDCPEKAAGLPGGNPAGLRQRMDAGHKERLIRIDVAKPGQQLLVHQPTLDGAAAGAHGAQELLLGHLLRVRPQSAERGFQLLMRAGAYPAEPPHIAKAQLLALAERQQHVCVRLDWRLARGDRELPGHAEAHQQITRRLVFGAELEGERLALALH